eukprot:4837714-Pyramimonas_sp.AAC.1
MRSFNRTITGARVVRPCAWLMRLVEGPLIDGKVAVVREAAKADPSGGMYDNLRDAAVVSPKPQPRLRRKLRIRIPRPCPPCPHVDMMIIMQTRHYCQLLSRPPPSWGQRRLLRAPAIKGTHESSRNAGAHA